MGVLHYIILSMNTYHKQTLFDHFGTWMKIKTRNICYYKQHTPAQGRRWTICYYKQHTHTSTGGKMDLQRCHCHGALFILKFLARACGRDICLNWSLWYRVSQAFTLKKISNVQYRGDCLFRVLCLYWRIWNWWTNLVLFTGLWYGWRLSADQTASVG